MVKDDIGNTEKVSIETESIRLDQFLKWAGLAGTGGQAKQLIGEGMVYVNKQIVTQRGKTLIIGDVVEFQGVSYLVTGLDG